MFEHRKEPLIPRSIFLKRLARSIGAALLLISISLGLGMLGYHEFEKLSWIDAYIEAAMILSGMGPTSTMYTTYGKLFSGSYALYSGLMLILIIGVMLAPIAHRFFHKFHLELDDED